MKLKMIKGPRPGQLDMVCLTSKGAFQAKIGDTIEVSDEAGHEILTKWGQCFQMDQSPQAKVIKKYKNKSVPGAVPDESGENDSPDEIPKNEEQAVL
jgi:hypothetical protein